MNLGIMRFAHLHAEGYIQIARSLPGVEFVGFADDDAERGAHFAKEFETKLWPSYEALLDQNLDGVIISSENNRHLPLVKMAADAGVHIMCEKPLAAKIQDGLDILKTCEEKHIRLMTAFPMRFSSPLMEIKGRLDAGDLGQIYCFNGSNQGELPKKHREWFVDPELSGGGALADHIVHLADVMRWYTGAEPVEVYAQSNKIIHADEVEVETGGMVMVTFDNGVFATIDCSWSRPPYWPSWGGLDFEMITERGSVLVDGFRQNLTVYTHAEQRPGWAFWGSDPNRGMIEEFVASLREDRAARVTGLDGFRAVEVVLAAYESVKTGQPVKIKQH